MKKKFKYGDTVYTIVASYGKEYRIRKATVKSVRAMQFEGVHGSTESVTYDLDVANISSTQECVHEDSVAASPQELCDQLLEEYNKTVKPPF